MRQSGKIKLNYKFTVIAFPALLVLIIWRNGINLECIWDFLLLSTMLLVAQTDYYTYKIPDELVVVALIISIMMIITCGAGIIDKIIGFFLISTILLILAMLLPGAIGGGDVKLMAATGLYLGIKGILVAAIIGSILAGFSTTIGIFSKCYGRKTKIAMAPFYGLGILLVLLV